MGICGSEGGSHLPFRASASRTGLDPETGLNRQTLECEMIFITGATGRVGAAIIAALGPEIEVRGALRDKTGPDGRTQWVRFDFADPAGFADALAGINAVFLMRPPQITKAATFAPFLAAMQERQIRRIVMLSVAGADRNPLIPHHAIEKLVKTPDFDWTILRPSDFMQNLETVHADGIRYFNEIAVPAGNGRSAFIDVADIGAVGARVLVDPGHAGMAYHLTGPQALSFGDVAAILTEVLGRPITYRSAGILRFVRDQTAVGTPLSMALVMSALYTIQRFGGAAAVTPDLEQVLHRKPTDFRSYAARQRGIWVAAEQARI